MALPVAQASRSSCAPWTRRLSAPQTVPTILQPSLPQQNLGWGKGLRKTSTLIPPGRTLGDVAHGELLEMEERDAIITIWRDYHAGKTGKVGVNFDPAVYRALKNRSTQCPLFVMPLHKSPSRFLTFVLQTKMPYLSVTLIDQFRELQEAATPLMVAAHYPELIESKGLALVQAVHIDAQTAGAAEHLTEQEALRLIRLCHMFYADGDLYDRFVKRFNHNQKDFDFDALVAEVAKLSWSDAVIQ